MPLDPAVAASVAHLFDATLAQVLRGEVSGAPAADAMVRADVIGETASTASGIPLRVYRSAGSDVGLRSALVWAHGGGWHYGDLTMPEADSVAQVAASQLDLVVVSVDYRKAPAATFPAPVDDVADAVTWVVAQATALGVDRSRIALGGASAGGHLAACAALRPAVAAALAALWLVYPVTDPARGPYPEERDSECPPLLWIDRDAISGMFTGHVGAPLPWPDDAVPATGDLAGLPPLLVTVAEYDGLAPQGRAFAAKARAAGVNAAVAEVASMLHGYLNLVGGNAVADAALDAHLGWLGTALGAARVD